VLVDRAPQVVVNSVDLHDDLVEVPLVTGPGTPPADLLGVGRTERVAPVLHGLMAEHDPAGRHQIRDVAQAQVEPEPQPHDLPDDDRREPVPVEAPVTARAHIHRRRSPRLRLPTRQVDDANEQVDDAA